MAKKILLADDSITIQKVVELTFSDGDYEVVAVNNGSKAIAKLQEWRPDIILSDIIMPEKNGYEVCEFVKSHPEYKSIPIILLTGTFEPFDPDRAERAGCDAVVTKPFESQSLIHKVDELIQGAAPQEEGAAAAPAPDPFDETKADRRAEAASAAPPPEPEEESSPFDDTGRPAPEDIFGTPPAAETAQPSSSFSESSPEPEPTPSAFGGETTAFPKMSFDDLQKMREEQAAPAPAAESSWESPPPAQTDEPAWPSAEPQQQEESPFGAGAAEDESVFGDQPSATAAGEPEEEQSYSAETTALPKMSFEDMQKAAEEQRAAASEAEAPAWPAPETPAAKPEWPTADEPAAAAAEPDWSRPEPEPATAAPASEPAEPSYATSEAPPSILTDEQVDRIARRVVELISDKVIRDVAWEVIPDLAQSVVRDRIRQLETEE